MPAGPPVWGGNHLNPGVGGTALVRFESLGRRHRDELGRTLADAERERMPKRALQKRCDTCSPAFGRPEHDRRRSAVSPFLISWCQSAWCR
jgi:hypothetical protein